jgi:hypothetical protein
MPAPLPIFDPSDVMGEVLNQLAEAIQSREIVHVLGGELHETPDGKILDVSGGSGGTRDLVRRIEIPAGGVANDASPTVDYYKTGDTAGSPSGSMTAANRSGVTMGGVSIKIGYAAWIQAEGEWQIIQEVCS